MAYVVSVERALREDTTPNELIAIAEWHDDKAEHAGRGSYKNGKRPHPNAADEVEKQRHIQTAVEVRRAAAALTTAINTQAAA